MRPLLVEVADFFNKQRFDPDGTGGGLELIFSDFIDSHCAAFENEAPLPVNQEEQVNLGDGSGMSLEYSALHQQYLQKFEDSCSWAIEVNQGSDKKFYDECEKAMAGDLPTGERRCRRRCTLHDGGGGMGGGAAAARG